MPRNTSSIRLAIVSSHPIQYNAPLFRRLSQYEHLNVKVFYSWKGTADQSDPEFGEKIVWDIPLLNGYDYCFIDNKASKPGTHHFFGLDNPRMIDEINNWRPDIVLVYGWAFKTHLSVLRYFHGKLPVFFRGDSTLLTGGNAIRQVFRRLWLKWVYKHIDVALYPGQRSKNYFLAHGVPLSKLIHIPHAIDNARFSTNDENQEKLALEQRRQLGISDDSLVLLFAGKLVPRKQPMFLVETVLELLRDKLPSNVDLIIVGTGPLQKELLKLAGDSNRIHFLGFKNQSEMPLVYRMADVYVLPSTIETWGLGVNESMACSRPVIVSDRVGCAPDLVKSCVSGEIFSAGDKSQLKKIISDYASSRYKVVAMRKLASNLIKDWSIESSASLIVKNITQDWHDVGAKVL